MDSMLDLESTTLRVLQNRVSNWGLTTIAPGECISALSSLRSLSACGEKENKTSHIHKVLLLCMLRKGVLYCMDGKIFFT